MIDMKQQKVYFLSVPKPSVNNRFAHDRMKMMSEFFEKYGAKLLAWISLFWAALAFVPFDQFYPIHAIWIRPVAAGLAVLFVVLYFIFSHAIIVRKGRQSKAELYENWEDKRLTPFSIGSILEKLQKGHMLEIIARSGIHWLCGGPNANAETRKELQGDIYRAVRKGGSIHFVIQNQNVPVPWFDKGETDLLRTHIELATKSFEEIDIRLKDTKNSLKDRNEASKFGEFKMSITNSVVANSMTRYSDSTGGGHFIFDISTEFQSQKPDQKNDTFKPFLLFETPCEAVAEFNEKFSDLLKSQDTYDKSVFDTKRNKGLAKIDSLIKTYASHSLQRGDTSKQQARIAADYHKAKKNRDRIPAPACVQLLVTNKCSSVCEMCDHGKMHNPDAEMNMNDLTQVLKMIKRLGTKSVVISGGEPLAFGPIFKVLEIAQEKPKLHIGLLTNGIRMVSTDDGENERRSLIAEEATIICNTCDWVQVSVDAFNSKTYSQIRKPEPLKTTLTSIDKLLEAGHSGIEACYTIQSENIQELVDLRFSDIPSPLSKIPIRFKIAHSVEESQFICQDRSLLERALSNLSNISNDENNNINMNTGYLEDMLDGLYFDYEDILSGAPIRKLMTSYSGKGYKCHILRHMCKIDANGDIYPCCFLFDDNKASSTLRDGFRLGQLKGQSNRIKSDDRLAEIWRDDSTLAILRGRTLPIDEAACDRCTRHFYQNEFLNEVDKVFDSESKYRLADEYTTKEPDKVTPFWM